MITLKGMAWNHTRGFVSVVATAQRFEELNTDIRIIWEKRSLQAFADASIVELSSKYDLLVMDHPHVALAAEEKLLVAYDEHLSADFLADQAANSVGKSHPSYNYHGKQWTLAIDAATPIATWRQDLMQERGLEQPQTWDEVVALARQGQVGMAAIPVDLLMHCYTFCHANGSALFENPEEFADHEALEKSLETLKEIVSLIPEVFQTLNPIGVAELMSRHDDIAYCPLGYGYSNYSRPGYAKNLLHAGDLVSYHGEALCSALGGAGLSISAHCKEIDAAMRYAEFTARPETQRGIFFEAGGQPGHRCAWLDDSLNARTNDFFKATLPALDRALLRPQYHGYMHFQDHACLVAHAIITGKTPIHQGIQSLNSIYRDSLNH